MARAGTNFSTSRNNLAAGPGYTAKRSKIGPRIDSDLLSAKPIGDPVLAIKQGTTAAVEAKADLLVVAATKGNELGEAASEVARALNLNTLQAHLDRATTPDGSGVFDGS